VEGEESKPLVAAVFGEVEAAHDFTVAAVRY